MTDLELLSGFAQNGSHELFAELYGRYAVRIRSFVHRFVRNAELAEDLAQQAWINVAVNASTFDGRSQVATWLFAVARNAAISYMRRPRNFREQPAGDGIVRLVIGGYDAPDAELCRREDYAALGLALRQLRPEVFRVIDLVDLDELDYEDAADVLEIPVGTIRSRRHRAIAQLRQIMVACVMLSIALSSVLEGL